MFKLYCNLKDWVIRQLTTWYWEPGDIVRNRYAFALNDNEVKLVCNTKKIYSRWSYEECRYIKDQYIWKAVDKYNEIEVNVGYHWI